MKLDKYKVLVKRLLIDYPQLRGNDRKLYLAVLWRLGYSLDMSVKDFFTDDSCPNYETVRRSRAKVQEECPELLPDEKIQKMRQEAEKEYLDFVRY